MSVKRRHLLVTRVLIASGCVLPPDHRERVLGHMRAAMRDMAHGQTTAECMFTHTQATDRRFPLATTDLQIVVPSDRPDATVKISEMLPGPDELVGRGADGARTVELRMGFYRA